MTRTVGFIHEHPLFLLRKKPERQVKMWLFPDNKANVIAIGNPCRVLSTYMFWSITFESSAACLGAFVKGKIESFLSDAGM